MTPRLGDSVISMAMRSFVVVEVKLSTVKAEPERGGRTRDFRIEELEQVEDGVWQEVAA